MISAAIMGLLTQFGGYLVAGVGLIAAAGAAWFTAKKSGEATQRAADAQKGVQDNAAATKARTGVDALGSTAVDDKLRGFQRK